jgi:hypothetical protein
MSIKTIEQIINASVKEFNNDIENHNILKFKNYITMFEGDCEKYLELLNNLKSKIEQNIAEYNSIQESDLGIQFLVKQRHLH